jgi:ATP/ADP translocase
MASYLVGRVVRDSLFLSRFPAAQLPYADIATALTVGVLIAVYIRLGRHFSLRGLLLGSLVLFASNCLLFWVLARFYLVSWLYPVIYIWDGMFGVLAPTQVWTLANHVLTTREARRVFGLLAGGAIAGGIFAGFFSKVVAKPSAGNGNLSFCLPAVGRRHLGISSGSRSGNGIARSRRAATQSTRERSARFVLDLSASDRWPDWGIVARDRGHQLAVQGCRTGVHSRQRSPGSLFR